MPGLAEYRACADAGMTRHDAAKKLGVTLTVLARRARDAGLTFARGLHKGSLTPAEVDRAMELKGSGMSWAKVAKQLGKNTTTVEAAVARRRNPGHVSPSRAKKGASKSTAATSAPETESLAAMAGPGGGATAGRAAAFHFADDDEAPEFVAPDPRQVQSLMARGYTLRAAIDQSVSDKKAAIRKAEAQRGREIAVSRPTIRVAQGPYRIGQSLLHALDHGEPNCKRLGDKRPTNFGASQ